MKKVSMQDIADSLGISKNSVSQALRDAKGVSEETKQLVRLKAREMGYTYKKADPKQRGKILLLATQFVFQQTSFFGEIIDSCQKKADDLGYQFETKCLTTDMLRHMTIPDEWHTYSGIVALSHSDNNYLSQLQTLQIPIVLVDHHHPKLNVDSILSQNIDGTYKAISLLKEQEITSIGFLGDTSFSPSYAERFIGYKQAVSELDLVVDDSMMITAIEESQGALFDKLKSIHKMPKAWFCVNSGLAFMLTSFLQSNGYTIPDDVSIMCFDDTEFTRMAHPTITNIATDLEYMGMLAIETLNKRIEGDTSPITYQQIMPEIVLRESVLLKN